MLVAVCHVAHYEVVTGQTLVAADTSTFENSEREARTSTNMNPFGSHAGGGTGRIRVREFSVRELFVPVSWQ